MKTLARALFLVCVLAAAPASATAVSRVSVNYACRGGDGESGFRLALSGDGNVVAFTSRAGNLFSGDSRYRLVPYADTHRWMDVLVHDRTTHRTELIAGGFATEQLFDFPALSHDGRLVAYSDAGTLAEHHLYVRDRVTGTTTFIAHNTGLAPSFSADGTLLAFETSDPLVPADTNGKTDVYVRDLVGGGVERVSVDSSGTEGDDDSEYASMSADGRYVAFESAATNLVPGDTNGKRDIFLHDRVTSITTRVSVDSIGTQADKASSDPSLSADGLHVAFESDATNLVAGDTNGKTDVFVSDLSTGAVVRASVSTPGAQANGVNRFPQISGDGGRVVWVSDASNLVPGDTDGLGDIISRDLVGGVTTVVSQDGSGPVGAFVTGTAISSDGGVVAFASSASTLVAGDDNGYGDVFVSDDACPGPGCTPACAYSVCQGGSAINQAKVSTTRLGPSLQGNGDEEMSFKGRLPYAPGMPVGFDPPSQGAQVAIEDIGLGTSDGTFILYDLSSFTLSIPPAGGECGLFDGWKVNKSGNRWTYRNKSGALPAASCAPGSAHGLRSLVYKDTRAITGDIQFTVVVKPTTIVSPFGALRGTIVLGADANAGAGGLCAIRSFTAAECKTASGGVGEHCR